ncbi:MAG: PQQ-binding-like beta-propeller repeat protein [Candidatus Aminicenantes bacterium]|nr:MAG: PQQ-binding-like beta-propeller repeat protein [Candidatus Aminicenantes bacterium]
MKKSVILIACVFVVTGSFLQAQSASDIEKYWHQWRGPFMTGVSPDGDPPVEWGETKNVKWKIAIPGKGHSTPIIWGDKIFILTAVETDKEGQALDQSSEPQHGRGMPLTRTTKIHRFVVMAVNRDDGRILWQKTVKEEMPQEGTHEFGSWASHSPVTDGEHVYAYFGSRGLYCLDFEGQIKWERDFGQLSKRMNFGEGSSPALFGDKIIITWDHEGQSFIVALDKKTGKDIWKVDRDEGTSWATPYVVEVNGKPQVIASATKLIRSYDLETGEQIWECGGMTQNAIPMPLTADGILYVMSGFRGNALLAIQLAKAKGNITDSDAIVWKHDKDTPYTPSPMIQGNYLYFLRGNNGNLSCFDAKTGTPLYTAQKLEGMGNIFASLVGAKDRIYVTGQKGTFYVVKQGPEFATLAKNILEDNFNASPVVLGKQLFLRGYKYLYCIEEE